MSTVGVSQACPPFFRALCRSAVLGGGVSYRSVGHGLCGALNGLSPDLAGESHWPPALAELERLACPPGQARESEEGVWAWFTTHLPQCLVLVPAHQKASFVAGVRQAFDDGTAQVARHVAADGQTE